METINYESTAQMREDWLAKQPAGTKFASGHFHVVKLQQPYPDLSANPIGLPENFWRVDTQKLIFTVQKSLNAAILNTIDLLGQ